ncbi:MAG: hypothetical protein PHS57_02140 [Alphaproteobacteria bacterium]|nr:hypothetical protein [Alphaproteobacteria bacterium]
MTKAPIVIAVGSWRPTEQNNSTEEQQRFTAIAEALGAAFYKKGAVLRVVWSNDHFLSQCSPLHDESNCMRIDSLENGLFHAKPENVRYTFPDTADYLVMKGYLEASQNSAPVEGAHVELLISNEMWCGSTKPKTVVWPRVAEHTIAGKTLEAFVNDGQIQKIRLNDTKNGREYLRSLQVSDLALQKDVAIAFALGGGKATEIFSNIADAKDILVPLPYCGSVAGARLKSYYEEKKEAWERLSFLFGKNLDTNYAELSTKDALANLEAVVGRQFFRFNPLCPVKRIPPNNGINRAP